MINQASQKEKLSQDDYKKSAENQYFHWLKYLFFWCLGFVLLYLAFRNQDFTQIAHALSEADYSCLFPLLIFTTFCHISRVLRWKILMQPLGFQPSFRNTFVAMMFGYLVNYAVPRLGEFSRCAALGKSDKIPFEPLLGTVVTERAIDLLSLVVVTLLAFCIEYQVAASFFINHIFAPIGELLGKKIISFYEIIFFVFLSILLIISVLYFFRNQFKNFFITQKLSKLISSIWVGVSSVARIEQKWLFVFHTIFIWCGYLLMTYLWFFAFDTTSNLGIGAGLVMMVVSSFGRTVPVQGGGMGAYHYLFAQGMLIFGIAAVYGNALAILIHGFQTVYYLVVGGACTLWLMRKPR